MRQALKHAQNSPDVNSTYSIAKLFIQFWKNNKIDNPPSLLISGFQGELQSVLEVQRSGEIQEHLQDKDSFGVIYHGDMDVAEAIVGFGNYEFNAFRIADAMNFCDLLITTTSRIQSLQRRHQTVSEKYDLLVLSEDKAEWVKKSTFEI